MSPVLIKDSIFPIDLWSLKIYQMIDNEAFSIQFYIHFIWYQWKIKAAHHQKITQKNVGVLFQGVTFLF